MFSAIFQNISITKYSIPYFTNTVVLHLLLPEPKKCEEQTTKNSFTFKGLLNIKELLK